jgi:hypothetical protein
MKSKLSRVVFYLAFGLYLAGCRPPGGEERSVTTSTDAKPAEVAPSGGLTLTPLGGGNPVALASLGESDRLLVFFAPWTDSGQAVVEWISAFNAGGIEVVPVVVDRQDGASIPGLAQPVYRADESLIKAMGGIRALPTAVWLAPDATMVGTWAGLPAFTGVVAAIQNRSTAP